MFTVDHLFKTLVLPILTYGLAVYGASDSDLNVIQHFLDRCHKVPSFYLSNSRHLQSFRTALDKSAFKRAIDDIIVC